MVQGEDRLPSSVLFACSMNAVRSPMAEGIMKMLFPFKVYVQSAGVHEGQTDGFAAAVMEEIGADISRHVPTTFEDLHDTSFDLIITLAPEAHHHALELAHTMDIDVEYWPTQDPTSEMGTREQRLAAYRRVRDQLTARIRQRFGWKPPASV
ncbi:MAG: low molecular weight phosphatase family protein [Rhodobiaceae bacterium]|nr:low molecular weight phosphatase family protein [Rhodobiaceae bacterium]MCC0015781.1 low molecular weight phosphatase family protein [Rhodobiaceae bacterium]MCC0040566.1 low molecular weight phosphatase family protein [Rhodobiaceae bacterium]MCC0054039.1 low molecular weight phosphatase family protein [Rhodobiaceae bacterium]